MRLSTAQRRWVFWTAAGLFATGALWLVFHYFLQVNGEFGPAPHPLERWWLRLHGAAAMLALVVVGSLLPVHVQLGWLERRNLPLGVALLSAVLLLTVSGYALYYSTAEAARPWVSALHWGVGLAGAVAMVWHVARGRRLAARPVNRQKNAPPEAGGANVEGNDKTRKS